MQEREGPPPHKGKNIIIIFFLYHTNSNESVSRTKDFYIFVTVGHGLTRYDLHTTLWEVVQGSTELSTDLQLEDWILVLVQKDSNVKKRKCAPRNLKALDQSTDKQKRK